MSKPKHQAAIAEFLGTFILVFAGTGAIVVHDIYGGITHLGIAITFGLVVSSVIFAYGDISGAHINPAVTIGFWLARRFPAAGLLPYLSAQFGGAICASLTLHALFPDHPHLGATLPSGTLTQSLILEIVMSWWLMAVILSVAQGAKERGLVAGLIIGAVVALEATFGGPVSGASMNPARSLGPALVSGNLSHLWIYLVAPVIGCGLATASHTLVHGQDRFDLPGKAATEDAATAPADSESHHREQPVAAATGNDNEPFP
ncbi:Aquaporin [Sulfidibacter corallicola]|uniref:Aquaporin n=1 Tax=Sulfidibacter corallicola TaxID=2818388 RepID=A0A8A4THX6_SULCO|nr:aquaporin [Sulfidibacter corallicola]QTD49526.1 aquaporin [Sulfidibacter corallicola]